MTEIVNENLFKNVVTATDDLLFVGFKLIATNQYQWSKKKLVNPNSCSLCPQKEMYWVYTIVAYADGCPLGDGIDSLDIIDKYLVEELADDRRKLYLTFEEEKSNVGRDMLTPQYYQKRDTLWIDAKGGYRIGV